MCTIYNLFFTMLYKFVKYNVTTVVQKSITTVKTNLVQNYCSGFYPVTSSSGHDSVFQEWLNACIIKVKVPLDETLMR